MKHSSDNAPMPNSLWTIPNVISFARLAGIPIIVYLGLDPEKSVWAFLVFVLAGFTDWLDGYLARRLNQLSKIGAALDPVADRLYIIVAVIVLLMRGLVPMWAVLLIASRDIVMAIHLALRSRSGYAPPQVHYIGKAATMMLLYSVPLIFLGAGDGALLNAARWFGMAFLLWGIAVYWLAGILYIKQYIVARKDEAHANQ